MMQDRHVPAGAGRLQPIVISRNAVWVLALHSFLCGLANSQTTPDAGSLRQQIEQPRGSLPLPPASVRELAPPEIRPPSGLSVQVKGFRFAGNTRLSTEALTQAVTPFVNQTLDFGGLLRAADAVTRAYREAGWIVRVYLPEQDVTEGHIALQVIEARFGGVRFEGEPPERVTRERLEAFFKLHQRINEPLGAQSLDRALLLSDDLPGVSVAGTFAQGQSDAETVLVLRTSDEPWVYGDLTLDNTGSRATGSHRLAANFNFNSLLGMGDLASVSALRTRGSEYGRFGITMPVGADGLRMGLNLSTLSYQVIDGVGTPAVVPVRGGSESVGFDLNYPIRRTRLSNIYWITGLEKKSFLNRDVLVRSDYNTESLRVGVSGNAFDEFAGGGANSASLQVVVGRLTQVVEHTQFATLPRAYRKLVYSASRQQAISDAHSVFVSLAGQHALGGLDSSEKFFVGGSSSVRAYPVSELGGERGQLLTAEWRWRVTPELTLSALRDLGRVVMLPASASDRQRALILRGNGLAMTWQGPYGLTPRLTWSRRDGVNPQPTPAGRDGDGTVKINRYWLSLTKTF